MKYFKEHIKNTIKFNQLENNQNLQTDYFNKYTTVYNQIENEKARDEAIRQWEAEMAEKQRQYDSNLAWQREQAVQEQANWEKEYALSQQSLAQSKKSSSGGGSSSSKASYSLTENNTSISSNGQYVNPKTNTVNPDASKGVFSNGYQPNNVGGNKLTASGYKVKDAWVGAYNQGGEDISSQTIWKSGSKYYVWDGSLNDYIDVTSFINSWEKHGKMGPNLWSY